MNKVKAFAPANISCVFKIYDNKNPRWMGSLGMGFTINEGVIVEVEKSKKTEVKFHGKKTNFPTVIGVVENLTDEQISVNISSSLPLGCGFGLSGASALATAFAINKLLNLHKTSKNLAIIAHTEEVKNHTGLGDVINQYFGGSLIKLTPSSHFKIKRLGLENTDVYCRYFSKLSTKKVLTNANSIHIIDTAATIALNKINELFEKNNKVSFREVISVSKEFAIRSKLLKNKRVIDCIESIEKKGGHTSMIMLGNAVFSDINFPGAKKFVISKTSAKII